MEKEILKECKHHGETSFVLEGRQYYRCKKCRVRHVAHRRRKVKILLVEYKGGKCQRCGYDKCIGALEFHHKDVTQKEFGISQKGETKGLSSLKKEVDKCELVCANCHREIHYIVS